LPRGLGAICARVAKLTIGFGGTILVLEERRGVFAFGAGSGDVFFAGEVGTLAAGLGAGAGLVGFSVRDLVAALVGIFFLGAGVVFLTAFLATIVYLLGI